MFEYKKIFITTFLSLCMTQAHAYEMDGCSYKYQETCDNMGGSFTQYGTHCYCEEGEGGDDLACDYSEDCEDGARWDYEVCGCVGEGDDDPGDDDPGDDDTGDDDTGDDDTGCDYSKDCGDGARWDYEVCACVPKEAEAHEPTSPCEQWPNCEEIGFKYSATECGTLEKMKCPFDETDTWYFCSADTECPSGYVSADSSCPSGQSFNLSSATAAGLKVCYSCQTATCPNGYSTNKPNISYYFEGIDTQYASDGQTECYKLIYKCNETGVTSYYTDLSQLFNHTYQQCIPVSGYNCRENANCDLYAPGSYNDECLSRYIDFEKNLEETGDPYSDCLIYIMFLHGEVEAYNTKCNKKLKLPNIEYICGTCVDSRGQAQNCRAY